MLNKTYLRSLSIDANRRSFDAYPFNIPAIQVLQQLDFHPHVTFLTGENGSGKSTLIEAIAIAAGFNPEGGSRNINFATQNTHSKLHEYLQLIKEPYLPKDGFFLRAESFYTFATEDGEINNSSLHELSHGESFMSVLQTRFRGSGLYILDEPESALSIQKQMEFLALIQQLVANNSQLIIATHSPILLSYPDATIYHLGDEGASRVWYEETEQYSMYRYFLNNYEKVLGEILDDSGDERTGYHSS